jgi:hypothetical protein
MEIDTKNAKEITQHGKCQDKISEQVTFSKQEKDAELPYHLLPKHTQQVTFSKKEKDAELPYHFLPEHTQQAMIINSFSLDEKTSVTFRLIVGFIQKFQSRLQKGLVDLSLSNAFSIAKLDFISIKAKSNSAMLINLPMSQQKAMIHFTTAVPSLLSNKSTWRILRERTQQFHATQSLSELTQSSYLKRRRLNKTPCSILTTAVPN